MLNIIKLLSFINGKKYLLIFILQNIYIIQCYLFPNSNLHFASSVKSKENDDLQ